MVRERYIDPTVGPLSAERLNPILADLEEWAREKMDELMREFFEAGYPVGSDPLPGPEQYDILIRLRDSGDPLYWHDPEAQAELRELEKRYGAAPLMAVPDRQPQPLSPQLLAQQEQAQMAQMEQGLLQFGGNQ